MARSLRSLCGGVGCLIRLPSLLSRHGTPCPYGLTPYSYGLTPHSYDLTPHPSPLTPTTSLLRSGKHVPRNQHDAIVGALKALGVGVGVFAYYQAVGEDAAAVNYYAA